MLAEPYRNRPVQIWIEDEFGIRLSSRPVWMVHFWGRMNSTVDCTPDRSGLCTTGPDLDLRRIGQPIFVQTGLQLGIK